MKTMKRTACLLLAVLLLLPMIPGASAATSEAVQAANELYELGLFQGTGNDANGNPVFDLDATPTRAQAVTMLVRLLGKENEASGRSWAVPFTDVPSSHWSAPYVGYAYANSLTTGMSNTSYGGGYTVTATQYLTFVLRALGYKSGTDFQWDKAWVLTDQLGITHGQYNAYSKFTRGDVAVVSRRALDAKTAGSGKTLAETLGLAMPGEDTPDPVQPNDPKPENPKPENPKPDDPKPTVPACKAIELEHEYGPMTVTTYYSTGRYWYSNQISSLVFTDVELTNIDKYKLHFSMQGVTDNSRAEVYVYFYNANNRMLDKVSLNARVSADTPYNISGYAWVEKDVIENAERIEFFSYSGHAAQSGSTPEEPSNPSNPDPAPSGKTVADLVNYISSYGKLNVKGNRFITYTHDNCTAAISYQPSEGKLSFMCTLDSDGHSTLTAFDYNIAAQKADGQLTVFLSENATDTLLFAAKADFDIASYTTAQDLTFRKSDFTSLPYITYEDSLGLCQSSVRLAVTSWEALLLTTAGMSLNDIGFTSFTLE